MYWVSVGFYYTYKTELETQKQEIEESRLEKQELEEARKGEEASDIKQKLNEKIAEDRKAEEAR